MKPLEVFCCLNAACPDFGKRGAGNLRVQQTYGQYQPIRLLECKTCGTRFSERRHTPLEGCRLPPGAGGRGLEAEERAVGILHHLAEGSPTPEGCGVRQTCRLTGASKDAVQRLQRSPEGGKPGSMPRVCMRNR